jgi:hypothetical protein
MKFILFGDEGGWDWMFNGNGELAELYQIEN